MNQDLMDVQSKLSFQEDTIMALSDEVVKQAEQIMTLQIQLKALNQKLNDALNTQGDNNVANVPPPHY